MLHAWCDSDKNTQEPGPYNRSTRTGRSQESGVRCQGAGESVDENGDENGLRVEILRIVHSRGRGIAALVGRNETEHEIG